MATMLQSPTCHRFQSRPQSDPYEVDDKLVDLKGVPKVKADPVNLATQLKGPNAYIVPDDVKEMILNATSAQEVDVKTRNRLYVAIGRMMERPTVSAEIVARWGSSTTHRKKFE